MFGFELNEGDWPVGVIANSLTLLDWLRPPLGTRPPSEASCSGRKDCHMTRDSSSSNLSFCRADTCVSGSAPPPPPAPPALGHLCGGENSRAPGGSAPLPEARLLSPPPRTASLGHGQCPSQRHLNSCGQKADSGWKPRAVDLEAEAPLLVP